MVAHHLRLFGIGARADGVAKLCQVSLSLENLQSARVGVLLRPSRADLATLGIELAETINGPQAVRFSSSGDASWSEARTLHATDVYRVSPNHAVAATTSSGGACWLIIRETARSIVVVGTDLAADLNRYRQGDPARAVARPTQAQWGIAGERPTYLFEAQQPEGTHFDRQADWWSMGLATTVARTLGQPLPHLLPGGAPGAVVVTGDDDQAYLEKYQEQLERLDRVPVTYFLHPLTRHTPETIASMTAGRHVEWGLHPDALEDPASYPELFRAQVSWFEGRFGASPDLVRNHGYLNDGYWGHLSTWVEAGIRASANLPGVNGRVLNGSLLPARVASGRLLTGHWSILTAIGDGVRFALGADGVQAARYITEMADRIEHSRLPGVIVLNLHPQNVGETHEMHDAVHAIVDRGFLAMTLGECIDWFAAKDRVA